MLSHFAAAYAIAAPDVTLRYCYAAMLLIVATRCCYAVCCEALRFTRYFTMAPLAAATCL